MIFFCKFLHLIKLIAPRIMSSSLPWDYYQVKFNAHTLQNVVTFMVKKKTDT